MDAFDPEDVHELMRKLKAAERLNGELKAALHKIACAECTVHDENCEIRKFSGSHDCACDPRVAGAAIPGYPCPILSKTEKRNHEEDEEREQDRQVPVPVGRCPKCGALWYTTGGFCGGCHPNGPLG